VEPAVGRTGREGDRLPGALPRSRFGVVELKSGTILKDSCYTVVRTCRWKNTNLPKGELKMPVKRRGLFRTVTAVLLMALALLLVAVGCGSKASERTKPQKTNRPQVNTEPKATKEKVTLYFGDKQAMYLVPEEREVVKDHKPIEQVIVEELIKGPRNPELSVTIPKEAKLLSIKVDNGVAYVDFSKEIQTKHWGGSAGEAMTIYSIVNSLAGVSGIEKVQFLVEGKNQESLLGHADTTGPIAPNWNMVKK